MRAITKYKIYKFNNILGNPEYQSLREVEFEGYFDNNFDTEEEAIQALLDDRSRIYESFVILKTVYITHD